MTQPAHAVPFYCPYCGDEDLRPDGDEAGTWWCTSCRRAWSLRYRGTGIPDSVVPPESGSSAGSAPQIGAGGDAAG